MKSIFVVSVLVAAAAAQEILSYDAGDHSHTASGDAGNKVTGSYSLQTPEGKTITVEYTADENGYVAKSDALPVAPAVPDVPDVPAVPEVKAATAEVKAATAEVKAATAEVKAEEPAPVIYAANPFTYAAHPLAFAAVPNAYHYGYSALPYHPSPRFAYSAGYYHI